MELIEQCCEKSGDIIGERILIFGGSGSLGRKTISRWTENNTIINVSRDEEKQWQLKSEICNSNLSQIIGDIANKTDVENAILTAKPTLICIFACLKHIDLCEKYPNKSVAINANGIMNVHSALMRFKTNVHTVLFVSTDKACLPITTYGCSKAIAEFFLQGVESDNVRWVGVRYGNVLNSSGSIIPYLRTTTARSGPFTLTHPDMTRFIMTLDQSVNLIEYALKNGKHNELIVPRIFSMKISELFELYAEKYKKDVKITGLRCKEKIHEDLISDSEAKMAYVNGGYYHIGTTNTSNSIMPFDSSMHLISKDILKSYLLDKQLL